MNRIVVYFYRNTKFGIEGASTGHFLNAKIAFSLLLLLWSSSILTYMDRRIFDKKLLYFADGNVVFFSCIAFVTGMYFMLNKRFITIENAEEMISDPEMQHYINNTKWIFWALVLMPLIIILVAGKKY